MEGLKNHSRGLSCAKNMMGHINYNGGTHFIWHPKQTSVLLGILCPNFLLLRSLKLHLGFMTSIASQEPLKCSSPPWLKANLLEYTPSMGFQSG